MTDALPQTDAVFESAVDAVVAGDAARLVHLLNADPGLIHARSARPHRGTLLHYTAANGVEEERQKTPANIVEIAELLLGSGAEVDAEAELYGGGATTLGLTATSIHPQTAAVQIELLETLLAYGASLDHENGAGNGQSLVESCLANGRVGSAFYLSVRGAPISFQAAAGLGLVERLANAFDLGGNLPGSQELQRGFFWACEYDRREVAEFLYEHGANLAATDRDGQTALHWAVIGGSVEIVRWLLDKNPPLDATNAYGGTPLGQAHWSRDHGGDLETYAKIIEMLEAASG